MHPISAIKELLFMTTLIVTIGLGAWEMAYGSDRVLQPDASNGQWSVSASSLRISGFNGNIEVETSVGSQVQISVAGDTRGNAPISVIASDSGEVSIVGVSAVPVSGVSVSSGNSSVVVVNGVRVASGSSVISINAASPLESPQLKVQLPQGIPLAIFDHRFQARVGDINAPLELSTTGDAVIGAVTSVDISVAGNGEVEIARVRGSTSVTTAGNAEVVIASGDAKTVGINAGGNSEVVIRAKATDAVVSAQGNSSVDLASVLHEPTLQILGNADVEVGE